MSLFANTEKEGGKVSDTPETVKCALSGYFPKLSCPLLADCDWALFGLRVRYIYIYVCVAVLVGWLSVLALNRMGPYPIECLTSSKAICSE